LPNFIFSQVKQLIQNHSLFVTIRDPRLFHHVISCCVKLKKKLAVDIRLILPSLGIDAFCFLFSFSLCTSASYRLTTCGRSLRRYIKKLCYRLCSWWLFGTTVVSNKAKITRFNIYVIPIFMIRMCLGVHSSDVGPGDDHAPVLFWVRLLYDWLYCGGKFLWLWPRGSWLLLFHEHFSVLNFLKP